MRQDDPEYQLRIAIPDDLDTHLKTTILRTS